MRNLAEQLEFSRSNMLTEQLFCRTALAGCFRDSHNFHTMHHKYIFIRMEVTGIFMIHGMKVATTL